MAKIIISYRRQDSEAITGRIFDRLVGYYGRDAVFRDIDNIPVGIDFRAHIADALRQSDVLLAVIGTKWAGRSRKAGDTRIHDESDPVRVEIETALQRGIPVIPVLLGSTKMPSASQVPDTLKDFAFRNAIRIDPGQDFEHHLDRLTRELDRILGPKSEITMGETAAETVNDRPALSLPDKASIAVLPFQNMSGDPEQEYFVDGMVEEIITALSRIRWLFVIARNSSFTYKGQTVDAKQVGRELGVRYLLEGSVRKAAKQVRITTQLIDTASGTHIWADRFDGALDDIFELQDRVASHVAGAVEPKLRLVEIERSMRKPTDNLVAYDLYLRALASAHQLTKEGNVDALQKLRRAMDIDPCYAPAAALAAWCLALQRTQGWTATSKETVAESVQLAMRAIDLGSEDPDALSFAGFALSFTGALQASASVAHLIDRAVELNPHSATGWGAKAWTEICLHKPDVAIKSFQESLRLSPRDPFAWLIKQGIALANIMAGRYTEAEQWVDQSLAAQPRLVASIRTKIVLCSLAGRQSDAREWLARLLELSPELTVSSYVEFATPMISAEMVTLFADNLRMAGLRDT